MTDLLSALTAIVVIDLVLAGDNAILIAMATRNVPAAMRRKVIIWGALGAVAVRVLMTFVAVWLLGVPGLLLVGGLFLLWIAAKLILDNDFIANVDSPDTVWLAIKTIVVADLIMGFDNMIAVAGASQGSFALVLIGLGISIPIVVFGATFLSRLLDRYPALLYIGATVLAATGAGMITSEAFLHRELLALPEGRSLIALVYVACIGSMFLVGAQRSKEPNALNLAVSLLFIVACAAVWGASNG